MLLQRGIERVIPLQTLIERGVHVCVGHVVGWPRARTLFNRCSRIFAKRGTKKSLKSLNLLYPQLSQIL